MADNKDPLPLADAEASSCGIAFEDRKCVRCKRWWEQVRGVDESLCPSCRASQREVERRNQAWEESRKRWVKKWEAVCPKVFYEEGPERTDINHPDFNKKAWESVSGWQYSPKGLMMFGPTGSCKSRCMFLLLYRLIAEEGRETIVLGGGAFRRLISDAYSESGRAAKRLLDMLSTVELLAWDDFGMDQLGAGTDCDLRSVIDRRYKNMLPTIYNTQYCSSTDLIKRMSSGDPIRRPVAESALRRIRESCKKVDFRKV